jgi:hypothetical protein
VLAGGSESGPPAIFLTRRIKHDLFVVELNGAEARKLFGLLLKGIGDIAKEKASILH